MGVLSATWLLSASAAWATSSSAGEEWLSITDAVEPNILFVVDLSSHMGEPCAFGGDGEVGDDDEPCIESVQATIDKLTQHYDWARYGIVGTTKDESDDGFTKIVPLGAAHSELSSAVEELDDYVEDYDTETRNLAEVLEKVTEEYFKNTTDDDGVDDDGDGFDVDWDEAPIQYHCQENHIIVLTGSIPWHDDQVDSSYVDSISPDHACDTEGESTADEDCQYDNVVHHLWDNDFRSDLSGTNNILVHTVSLGVGGTSLAETLYGNSSDVTDGDAIYTSTSDGDAIMSVIMFMLRNIRSGYFSRSSPVITADGAHLIYSYYQIGGTLSGSGGAFVNPQAEGHVRAYEIEDDPAETATYGQVKYQESTSDIGGALWDAGELLVSRLVTSGETNPEDRDGFGRRDIYTFFEPAVAVMSSESSTDKRQGLDRQFVLAVGGSATVMDEVLDADTESDGTPSDTSYDLNEDDTVDIYDLQMLVDFIRGWPRATYRYLGIKKGYWKLYDSPHAVPLVVQNRTNVYSMDSTYRTFLAGMEAEEYPDMVFVPANDGMLHAFYLKDIGAPFEDLDATEHYDEEAGREAWAWLPGYLLEREHDADWAGRAIDMMLYGRTFLFDGTPVYEDVWIDANGDNEKDCESVPDNCEWRRVLVVQQGKGGPVTLALDITDPTSPEFLWEQTDEEDTTAMGYTVGRPVITNVYDTSGTTPKDRWVAMWGSGRAVPYGTSESYYKSSEANLYMWHVGDTYFKSEASYVYSARGDNGHPESSAEGSDLQYDSDSHYEYGYIAAALSVVDTDSDGDADTVYFPVTAAYKPTSEDGDGPDSVKDPGSTWMYKACIDSEDPDDLQWVEFFDPVDDGDLSRRPEVYFAATTSWHTDGQLGVYWGSGTPYDRDYSSSPGYLFAVKDSNPKSCSSFDVNPMTDCGDNGIYELDPGEGLTADPIVYAGVVYFTTWVPEEDRCEGGAGRLYGIDFEDCSEGLDSNDDGDVDSTDKDYIEYEDEYLSSVTVTEQGSLLVGTSSPDTDYGDKIVTAIDVEDDPFLGTAAMAWLEVF
jgi:hypothetical protein